MIRNFTPNDISNFPEVKVFEEDGMPARILIERRDFISCFIIIDNLYSIFVEQYRSLIQKKTLEVPMGKIENFDNTLEDTVIRELQEECNLFVRNGTASLHIKKEEIFFPSAKLEFINSCYPSPGFSNYQHHRFALHLCTNHNDFIKELNNRELISQETNIKVHIKELQRNLLNDVCGITQMYLLDYFLNHIE